MNKGGSFNEFVIIAIKITTLLDIRMINPFNQIIKIWQTLSAHPCRQGIFSQSRQGHSSGKTGLRTLKRKERKSSFERRTSKEETKRLSESYIQHYFLANETLVTWAENNWGPSRWSVGCGEKKKQINKATINSFHSLHREEFFSIRNTVITTLGKFGLENHDFFKRADTFRHKMLSQATGCKKPQKWQIFQFIECNNLVSKSLDRSCHPETDKT